VELDAEFPALDAGVDEAKMVALFQKIYQYIESGYTGSIKTKNTMRKYFLVFFTHKMIRGLDAKQEKRGLCFADMGANTKPMIENINLFLHRIGVTEDHRMKFLLEFQEICPGKGNGSTGSLVNKYLRPARKNNYQYWCRPDESESVKVGTSNRDPLRLIWLGHYLCFIVLYPEVLNGGEHPLSLLQHPDGPFQPTQEDS